MATPKPVPLTKSGVLVAALKVTPEQQPARFAYAVPEPKFDPEAYVHATLWICDRTKPLVDKKDRELFMKWTELARKQLVLGPDDRSLKLLTPPGKIESHAIYISSRAVQQAGSWIGRFNNNVWTRSAARAHAEMLIERGGDVTAYLVELDVESARQEALSMLRFYKLATSKPAAQLVWRGVTGKKATHWLLALGRKQLALVHKIGARWAVTEGERAHVIAHVPDAHLEAAAEASA